jgi:hypothetical protein
MKVTYLFATLLFLASCSETGKKTTEENTETTETNGDSDLAPEKSAEDWLMKAVPEFFDNLDSDLSRIATPEYAEYKTDAMDVIYGEFTIPLFEEKWKGKYDVSEKAVGQGFLIDAQDYVKIEITSCDFIKKDGDRMVFKTTIEDKTMKLKVKREIYITEYNGEFRICDVR